MLIRITRRLRQPIYEESPVRENVNMLTPCGVYGAWAAVKLPLQGNELNPYATRANEEVVER